MNITFLLSSVTSFPAGGFKVIFEYANRFAAEDNSVNIVMIATNIRFKSNCAALLRYPYYKLTHNYGPQKWFSLHKNVHCYYHFALKKNTLPKSDVVIATAVESSIILNKIKPCTKCYYFVQDFEDWGVSARKVYQTYTFPFTKIVIAPWLQQKVESVGEKAVVVPNGFDFDYFKLYKPIEKRNKLQILMMYHKMERKRCVDSIAALQIVKNKYPQLEIKMFGKPERPKNLSFDFEYYQSPDKETHNQLYNEAAIYIAASSVEGWGLTIGEAMICGCAVACTDNEGFKIMAHDNETALLSPVYDYNKLAENIIRLIEDDELRIWLAKKANENIQQYTWDNSYKKFKEIILN